VPTTDPKNAPMRRRVVKQAARVLLALAMASIGVLHFLAPSGFVKIVPKMLPAPLTLVYVSGFFEILGGLGLLWPRTRRLAGWGLIALFVAVFPANINMAVNDIQPEGMTIPEWAMWLRLPFQVLFIAWAWWCSRDGAAPANEAPAASEA